MELTDFILKSKYIRKVPDGKGGWRYIYHENKGRVNGVLPNSITEYANDPNRKLLHRKTVEEYVSKSTRSGIIPNAVFTLGGGGAGKSTVLKQLRQENNLFKNIVAVDSDDFKTKTFKKDFDRYNKQELGSAARRLHTESSNLAEEVVDGILNVGNDYLKDGTFKSYDKAVAEILKAKNKGYQINVVGVTISVEEALKRAELRAQHSGREVPEDVIIDAHKGSTDTFLKLIESGLVDDLKLYDNSKTPTLIYDSNKKNPIINKTLFEEFKRKKDFVMSEKPNDKISKSYNFDESSFNRRSKRRWQERIKKGLPVGLDIPNDANEKDLCYYDAYLAWLNDGKPVAEN